jgi:hypothetical protein
MLDLFSPTHSDFSDSTKSEVVAWGQIFQWTVACDICSYSFQFQKERIVTFSNKPYIAALIVLGMSAFVMPVRISANLQSTGQTNIPDPTPRDRDLHDRYNDSTISQEQRKRIEALRMTQQRAQAAADTEEIVLLAHQIQSHRVNRDGRVASPPDATTAQKIESLAKRVRENMQSR